jgi:hypothetical protein
VLLNQLWVDKHKPQTVAQLVGNGKLVSDLRAWLNEWQRRVPVFFCRLVASSGERARN